MFRRTAPWAAGSAASRRRRAAITAASAPMRCSAVTSSRHMDACQRAGQHLRHQRRGHAWAVGVPDRSGRRWKWPTSCGSPAGCCIASGRTRRQRHARSEAGQGRLERCREPTPTSRPRPCARATTPSSRPARRWPRGAPSTSRSTGTASRTASPAHETAPYTEYSYGVSNRGASVRIPWQVEVERRATSRIAGPTPTAIPTTSASS